MAKPKKQITYAWQLNRKHRRKPGRDRDVGPTLRLNNAMVKRMCDRLRTGATYQHAAEAEGVSADTFRQWMKVGRQTIERRRALERTMSKLERDGRKGCEEYAAAYKEYWRLRSKKHNALAQFARRIDMATAAGALRHHGVIDAAAQMGDWKASAWLLTHGPAKKVYRKEAAQVHKHSHEHTGADGGPIAHLHAKVEVDGLLEGATLEQKRQLLELLRQRREGAQPEVKRIEARGDDGAGARPAVAEGRPPGPAAAAAGDDQGGEGRPADGPPH